METIWKYLVPMKDNFELSLPRGAKVLSVDTQVDIPHVWVLIDPDEKKMEQRYFRLAGTGQPIYVENAKFIGTFQTDDGWLVFHLFEVL